MLDYVFTFELLARGCVELNPFVPVYDVFLFPLYFSFSFLAIYFFAYIFYFLYPFREKDRLTVHGKIGLVFLIILRAIPVIHNFLLLFFNYESPLSKIFYELLYKHVTG